MQNPAICVCSRLIVSVNLQQRNVKGNGSLANSRWNFPSMRAPATGMPSCVTSREACLSVQSHVRRSAVSIRLSSHLSASSAVRGEDSSNPLAQVRQIKIFFVIFKKNIIDANQSEVILGTISSCEIFPTPRQCSSRNLDLELKNGSGCYLEGLIAWARFEATTYQIFVSGSAWPTIDKS